MGRGVKRGNGEEEEQENKKKKGEVGQKQVNVFSVDVVVVFLLRNIFWLLVLTVGKRRCH